MLGFFNKGYRIHGAVYDEQDEVTQAGIKIMQKVLNYLQDLEKQYTYLSGCKDLFQLIDPNQRKDDPHIANISFVRRAH